MVNDFFLLNFLKKKKKRDNKSYLKIMIDRGLKIDKTMIGLNVAVYNGKFFIPIKIKEAMVGSCLGAFSFSFSILLKKKKTRYEKKNLKKK